MSARAYRNEPTDDNCFLPRLFGRRGAVATHHYLSADAAATILKNGGNAVDAAVAAVLAEGVLNPHMGTIGGECPLLIKMADRSHVVAINGNLAAPGRATPEEFRRRGYNDAPDEGVLAAGVPATPGALVTSLIHFGRLRFTDVAAAAIDLARHGFPVSRGLIRQEKYGLRDLEQVLNSRWPSGGAIYLPNGKLPVEGQLIRNPPLADMLSYLANKEKRGNGDRVRGLQCVLDAFYRGDVADTIAKFCEARDGLLQASDLARFETKLEEPVSVTFGGTEVFKCGPWTQGPALLQALSILKSFDLHSMEHNSADYLHCLIESIKLAFADREQFYGDPDHVTVPIDALLSDDYGRSRASLVDMSRANSELRPGDPSRSENLMHPEKRLEPQPWGAGTVHVDVADADGNMVAATPSGAWLKSAEVIGELGFPLSVRLLTFYLGPPNHPNIVAPHKRPRTTISPSMATRNGAPWMAFGSMGGDQQDQWQLQFFLNRAVFGMPMQDAIEAAKFSSEHFPGFFAPHVGVPNFVRIEPRVKIETINELRRRGHEVEIAADWSEGYIGAVGRNLDTGLLEAGCDPRGTKGEVFPAYALCW